jgi:hypothetical protein
MSAEAIAAPQEVEPQDGLPGVRAVYRVAAQTLGLGLAVCVLFLVFGIIRFVAAKRSHHESTADAARGVIFALTGVIALGAVNALIAWAWGLRALV